jgi:hypothetical protein
MALAPRPNIHTEPHIIKEDKGNTLVAFINYLADV